MNTPTIELYTLGGAFEMRSVSPFCLKLEMLLANLGLDYTSVIEPDPRKAPKGKMPWARINGEVIADSEIIIERLDTLTQGRVYEGLSPQQQAIGLAMVRLAEEHLYWLMASARWLDDNWWPYVKRDFLHIVPAPIRGPVSFLLRRRMRQTVNLQGLGMHSAEEQAAFARRDLQALQSYVSEGTYLLGDHVCVYDFGVASIMAGIYDNKPSTWLTQLASDYPQLKEYTDSVQRAVGVFGRQ